MVGRLAMNNAWEISKMDREFYGSIEDTMTREEILLAYADFAQEQGDILLEKYPKSRQSNSILVRPICNLFVGEFKGAEFRKRVNGMSSDHTKYKGNIRVLIHDAIEWYRTLNPDALQCRNGERTSVRDNYV